MDNYEEIREHEREESWAVTIGRYLLSVAVFLLIIAVALGGYWLWEDFSAPDAGELTWQSAKQSLSNHFRAFIAEIRNPCPLTAGTCE